MSETEQLRAALDQAILDHRVEQTEASRERVMLAGRAYADDFMRREIAEAQARTH